MPDLRANLSALMNETVADEQAHGNWTYLAVRPLGTPPPPWVKGKPVKGDCSLGVRFLCRWAGVPDPMKQNFDDYGNSSTLCLRLQHLDSPSELLIGDIVTFGRRGDEHAAMVAGTGSDPLLWSFGHQGAPNFYRLSQDRREHQCLRNPVAAYVPTPQDRLRASTGFWSWMQWRLGEGSWHGYPKAAPKVRPNVPKLIPARWWADLALFLTARNKPNKKTTGY